ncbi:MAG: hypothetical protein CR975_06840 [Gammaproteobacteria bacterium]|nr:MAG: hypothetical protein CR975_06840 [Gammaproteobacteria bacterium]
MQTILSLQQVDFSQSGIALLQGIDLRLQRGRVSGLLGINGAGKSTTLKIAAGLLIPNRGKVDVLPQATIGYLPEIPPLIDAWSVKGFLRHICHLHHLPKVQHQSAIDRVVALCQLEKIFRQSIVTLSKGNRQRVAIAQAIIHQPDILILDEPTSGLDPQQISLFRHLMQTVKATTAVLLSSHIIQEIMTLCDEVAVIHQGQKKQTLSLQRQQDIVIELRGDVPLAALRQLPEWQANEGPSHHFVITSQKAQDRLLDTLLAMGISIHRIYGSEQILENTFLRLIGQSTTPKTEGMADA